MEKIYSCYKCMNCKCETILINEQVKVMKNKGKYLSCSYCGSKHIEKIEEHDNFKTCMRHAAYRRINGALRQVRDE